MNFGQLTKQILVQMLPTHVDFLGSTLLPLGGTVP